jgi:hypothetical protein
MTLRQLTKAIADQTKAAAAQRELIGTLMREDSELQERITKAHATLTVIERDRARLRKQKSRRITGRN